MSRPRLLDLYCRAGGSSRGYYDAGFDVDGVDWEAQKHFPKVEGMRFFQSDALEFLRDHWQEYDAIAASPPCEGGSALSALHRVKGPEYDARHPNLIPATREALVATGKPYVIENVEGYRKELRSPVMLCGSMFGLQTDCGAVLRRHRLFEANWLLMVGLECQHEGRTVSIHGHGAWDHSEVSRRRKSATISVHGDHARDPSIERGNRRVICVNGTGQRLSGARTKTITITGSTPHQELGTNRTARADGTHREKRRETFPVSAARTAMGIDWMPMKDLAKAIPPRYTEYIGLQLREMI